MTTNYNATIRSQRLAIPMAAIDAAGGNGNLRLLDSAGNILSTLQLARPAVSISGVVGTFNGLSLIDPAAAASGLATAARIEDSAGTVIASGITVGGVNTVNDITLSPNNTIAAGQTIAIQQATVIGN